YIPFELFENYKIRYKYPKKGDILISAAGTIGRTVTFDGEPSYFQDSNIVWIDNDESKVLNRYLAYCYEEQPWVSSDGGTISRLYNENIEKAEIPAPHPELQNEIVRILDKFSTLCNDLTSRLPAEIEARKKQYEYYRDKLLSFKPLKRA
ncbi:MAG: restriction endonuclease subunit S, partial [Akkermansia sp.]